MATPQKISGLDGISTLYSGQAVLDNGKAIVDVIWQLRADVPIGQPFGEFVTLLGTATETVINAVLYRVVQGSGTLRAIKIGYNPANRFFINRSDIDFVAQDCIAVLYTTLQIN